MAPGGNDWRETEPPGLLSPESGEESPPQKVPATDAIFAQIATGKQAADAARDTLRRSMDAKATVKVGPCARGGQRRVPTVAVDHDLQPAAMVPPVGLLVPTLDALLVYGITAKVTSACWADCLARWWEAVRPQCAQITTRVIHLENGPENQSRRPQCMQRMVTFAQQTGRTIRLASSPPYHSKDNPLERCWGLLENHWNGALLDSIDAVIPFATTMTWKGSHPVVALVTPTYETGIKRTKAAMQAVEARLTRLPGLEKWFVDIRPTVATVLSG